MSRVLLSCLCPGVKILVKSKLRAFSHTKNGLRTARRRPKLILERGTKRSQFIKVFAKHEGKLEKKAALFFFQDAIRSHPFPSRPLFWVSLNAKTSFGFLI